MRTFNLFNGGAAWLSRPSRIARGCRGAGGNIYSMDRPETRYAKSDGVLSPIKPWGRGRSISFSRRASYPTSSMAGRTSGSAGPSSEVKSGQSARAVRPLFVFVSWSWRRRRLRRCDRNRAPIPSSSQDACRSSRRRCRSRYPGLRRCCCSRRGMPWPAGTSC